MTILNALLMAAQCFFGGSLILVLALVFARSGSASRRHLVLTGALAVLLVLPLALLAIPSQLVWHLAAVPQQTLPQTIVQTAPATQTPFDPATIVIALIALWGMGVIFNLSKAAFGGFLLHRLYEQSVPHIPEGIAEAPFKGLGWQLRLRTMPDEGGPKSGPMTFGLFRPIVLLPKASVTWPRARLEAVLLHEAAHVRRKDCLTRLIAVIACAFYWPNPLVWIAARVMRREGEAAADDCVLASGFKPSAYAGHLVGLARAFSHPAYGSISLAMAEPAMLDARIEDILNPARSRKAISRGDIAKIALMSVAATALLALARPSLAETQAAPENASSTAAQDAAQPNKNGARTPIKIVADKVVIDASGRKGSGPYKTVIQYDSRDPGTVRMTTADAPATPDAPEVPEAPEVPKPMEVSAPPAPPAPPAAIAAPAKPRVVRLTETDEQGHVKVTTFTMPSMNKELRREVARAMADAKQAQAEAMRSQAEEIRKALANAHIEKKVMQAVNAHKGEIKKAQAEAGKAIAQAVAEVDIPNLVSQILAQAGPIVHEALKQQAHRHVEISVDGDEK